MEQKSDVEFRAEKLYKNSREKFGYLIREVVSNAIHATIIRNMNENDPKYNPNVKISVDIDGDKKNIVIVVKDNGDGFTEINRKYFTHLDTKNHQKEKLNLHPIGQGRLSIIYFSNKAFYQSVYKNVNDKYMEKHFSYPEVSLPLFDIEKDEGVETDRINSETILTLTINKQNTYKRANTFFSKYLDIDRIKDWFIENFFPFFMENEKLEFSIDLNGQSANVNKSYIEKNVTSIPFSVRFDDEPDNITYEFKIWLAKKEEMPRSKNYLTCFARHLRAEIEGGKIEYEIDLPFAYDWFLTSEYFDDNVDQKGDKIEIPSDHIEKIQLNLITALDKHFSSQIKDNRNETKKSIKSAKEKYHSLSPFIDDEIVSSTKTILNESDLLNSAIEIKGKIEKEYWTSQEPENEDIEKLLNSSLHIYVDHRKRVLNIFKRLINKFDNEGELKPELEADLHDLLIKRGKNFENSDHINHLHNLWILDDKYTIFSETFNALSTKQGQKASDVYLWIDDPDKVKELLILEVKSTTHAHNAGDKYESMIAQVKRYANQFYMNPTKTLNWHVDPNTILYSGIILSRKSDIYKELSSNNVSGNYHKIPFLEASYFFNENFSISNDTNSEPKTKPIRIDMYSYEDIYKLSLDRNNVFFKLLSGEFKTMDETKSSS